MNQTNTDALLTRLLATPARDERALYAAHRALLHQDPSLYRRLVSWLLDRADDERDQLVVALALLAVDDAPAHRALVGRALDRLPIDVAVAVVDHVRGWTVKKLQAKASLKRFDDEMSAAYRAKAQDVQAELVDHGPDFTGGEVVVTLGQFDRVQQVLDYLELPYRLVPCGVVKDLPLRADQVLIVNCPGNFDEAGIGVIEAFVRRGGTLVTTDWALKTTVQRAFPGTIAHNGVQTADDVVNVSWIHPDDEHTRGVDVPGHTLEWWLEGASYPIEILDERRVTVLMDSAQMGARYGRSPLVVSFAHGEGVVFHLTSHYYLQRSKAEAKTQEAAAYSSLKLLGNILYQRRRVTGA